MYIDTTFCQPEAFYFPTRDDSAAEVINLMSDWLDEDAPEHVVFLHCKANLGYEHLFAKICDHFKMKVCGK